MQLESPIFFIHIPKTAGTSIRVQLNEIYGQYFFPSTDLIEMKGGNYPENSKLKEYIFEYKDAKLYMGHYPFRLVNSLDKEFLFITFLREPTERILSHLVHYKTYDPRFKDLSLEELYFSNTPVKDAFRNLQARYLSNRHFGVNNNDKLLKEASNNLLKFKFYGLTEFYYESIHNLNKLLNIKIDPKGQLNTSKVKTSNRWQDIASEELIATIEKENETDLKLYQFAIENFKSFD